MRIIFVRHGEPDYENDCLTPNGRIQAELAAERLKDEGIEEIYSSPLGRAGETAEYTSKVLGIPVQTLECVREIKWGSRDGNPIFADGHPWDIADKTALEGMDITDISWRENKFFCNNIAVEKTDIVEKGIDEWLSTFGYVRNGLYYDHIVEEEEHKTVAVFCHGGSSSAAIGRILNLPFPYVCALLHTDFTGITIIRMERKKGAGILPCLELASDERHIKKL